MKYRCSSVEEERRKIRGDEGVNIPCSNIVREKDLLYITHSLVLTLSSGMERSLFQTDFPLFPRSAHTARSRWRSLPLPKYHLLPLNNTPHKWNPLCLHQSLRLQTSRQHQHHLPVPQTWTLASNSSQSKDRNNHPLARLFPSAHPPKQNQSL